MGQVTLTPWPTFANNILFHNCSITLILEILEKRHFLTEKSSKKPSKDTKFTQHMTMLSKNILRKVQSILPKDSLDDCRAHSIWKSSWFHKKLQCHFEIRLCTDEQNSRDHWNSSLWTGRYSKCNQAEWSELRCGGSSLRKHRTWISQAYSLGEVRKTHKTRHSEACRQSGSNYHKTRYQGGLGLNSTYHFLAIPSWPIYLSDHQSLHLQNNYI